MIISPQRRYIFVHIPKTGGTALTLALESRAMRDDILIGDTPKARARASRWQGASVGGRIWKHSTLADIDGLVPDAQPAAMFVLTLVRNPWDRMVSYYHWLREQRFDHPAVHLAKALPFAGFVTDPQTVAGLRAYPCVRYTSDATGRDRVTLAARLEHLDDDLEPFWTHLGFSLSPLARTNVSARSADWRPYYTAATAASVAETCAVDIARFGYRFDPVS